MKKKIKIPQNNKELAYFLGCVAGDGYNDLKNGAIRFSVKDNDFASVFKKTGERLFNIKASFRKQKLINENHADIYNVTFYSRELSDFIGDMRGNVWPNTIKKNFSFILKNPKYIISFLKGYFDSEGSVSPFKSKKWRIRITIGYKKPAYFVLFLLKKIKIKGKIFFRGEKTQREKIKGVIITGIGTIIKFSKKISSSIKRKEKRLNEYRNKKIINLLPFIEQSYKLVYKLREKHGWGRYKIVAYFKENNIHNPYYPITPSKVNNWLFFNQDPTNKKGNKYFKIIQVHNSDNSSATN